MSKSSGGVRVFIPLIVGLTGVAVGAVIGATTGLWWMMGVLGGAFAGISYAFIGSGSKR
jgi:hypothetical protein